MATRSGSKRNQLTPRVLVANGVNLDLLGRRESEHYGTLTLAKIEDEIKAKAPSLAASCGFSGVALHFFQTNVESELYQALERGWDGIVLNAGAWTHTSLALADRLSALRLPFAEVHLSNLARRETIRHQSYTASLAIGVVFGFGADSYLAGLYGLLSHLARLKG